MLNMAKSDGEKIYYTNLSTPIPVETSCLYVCSPKRGLQTLNGEVKPNKKTQTLNFSARNVHPVIIFV